MRSPLGLKGCTGCTRGGVFKPFRKTKSVQFSDRPNRSKCVHHCRDHSPRPHPARSAAWFGIRTAVRHRPASAWVAGFHEGHGRWDEIRNQKPRNCHPRKEPALQQSGLLYSIYRPDNTLSIRSPSTAASKKQYSNQGVCEDWTQVWTWSGLFGLVYSYIGMLK